MGLKCLFGHQWNGCKCERCGKIRELFSLEEMQFIKEEFKYANLDTSYFNILKRQNDVGKIELTFLELIESAFDMKIAECFSECKAIESEWAKKSKNIRKKIEEVKDVK